MKINGFFTPPKMGNLHVPIPVSGPGFIEATPYHLVVSGFESTRGYSGLIASAVVALLIGAGALSGFFPQEIFVGLIIIIATHAVGVALKGSGKHEEDKPMVLEIPWDKIKKVAVDPIESDLVLIIIKRFKPKGAIYFRPSVAPKTVCSEIFEFLPR